MLIILPIITIGLLVWASIYLLFYSFDKDEAKAQIPQSVIDDVEIVCHGYPYRVDSVWYRIQQDAWERQGRGYYIPNIEQVNKFCKQKGL